MRIIIETEERAGTPVQTVVQPTQEDVADGGTPPESLFQPLREEAPELTEAAPEREGTNGGSPPEWLVEAIQGATLSSIEATGGDVDAGAAPDTEA